MKKLIVITFLVLNCILLSGQSASYTKDSVSIFGVKILNKGELDNSKYCHLNSNKVILLSPKEIDKYVLENGTVYCSKQLQIGNVDLSFFAEQVTTGSPYTLYYLRNKLTNAYIFEKDDSTFVFFTNDRFNTIKDYKTILYKLTTDNKEAQKIIPLVKLNKYSLLKLSEYYNDPNAKHFPVIRYGISAGLDRTYPKLATTLNLYDPTKTNESKLDNWMIGAFVDIPGLTNNLSLYSKLSFTKLDLLTTTSFSPENSYVEIKSSSLILPVMVKYKIDWKSVRPYFSLGPSMTYHFKKEHYNHLMNNNEEIFSPDRGEYLSSFMFGYQLGPGFEINIDLKRLFFIEMHYAYAYGFSDRNNINLSHIQLTSGIAF